MYYCLFVIFVTILYAVQIICDKLKKIKLRGLSLRANYTY
jgi:hypothetical protein